MGKHTDNERVLTNFCKYSTVTLVFVWQYYQFIKSNAAGCYYMLWKVLVYSWIYNSKDLFLKVFLIVSSWYFECVEYT